MLPVTVICMSQESAADPPLHSGGEVLRLEVTSETTVGALKQQLRELQPSTDELMRELTQACFGGIPHQKTPRVHAVFTLFSRCFNMFSKVFGASVVP